MTHNYLQMSALEPREGKEFMQEKRERRGMGKGTFSFVFDALSAIRWIISLLIVEMATIFSSKMTSGLFSSSLFALTGTPGSEAASSMQDGERSQRLATERDWTRFFIQSKARIWPTERRRGSKSPIVLVFKESGWKEERLPICKKRVKTGQPSTGKCLYFWMTQIYQFGFRDQLRIYVCLFSPPFNALVVYQEKVEYFCSFFSTL